MSTMVNDNLQNNDMASNISNLNNMPNIAKNAEYGIENMAHLDNIQIKLYLLNYATSISSTNSNITTTTI